MNKPRAALFICNDCGHIFATAFNVHGVDERYVDNVGCQKCDSINTHEITPEEAEKHVSKI